ncbi:hypothetical protein BDK51DRAFT_34621 [Blyttiomyces helicus]|uniref:Tyrosinase copper-binding domain-containing protein n=1 Tax=Blyttiomyces helicus TaxID=388810 RepID=A0A4P9WCD3_9FUNG|nr:hypothetical protein BDK51DRAFT_34621 [Blyttiomyces helicus]|eukprot:RKO88550.1 hypothetical protein BDK51DRAFT_34621 [Blyttiomyces helicus]
MSRFPASELSYAQPNLNKNGGVGNLTIWEQIAFLHNTAGDAIHGNGIFLLFHRKFIAWFEQLMMEANPDFTGLFYWATEQQPLPSQWSKDPIWDHLGKAVGRGREIVGGPLENITFPIDDNFASPRSLIRDYDLNGSFLPSFASAASYKNAFARFGKDGYGHGYTNSTFGAVCNVCLPPDYGWADAAQNLHFTFHKAQGGQMSNYFSPLDFLFWIHHSNVDRIYHDVQVAWQGMGLPQEKQIYGNSYLDVNSESLTLKTPLPYFTEYTVDDVQFSAQMCVQYAPPVNGPPAPPPATKLATAPAQPFEKFTAAFWEKILVGRTPEQRAAHAASFEQFMAGTDEEVASGTPIDGNAPRSSMRIKNGRRSPRA